jgi:hypothetical protein
MKKILALVILLPFGIMAQDFSGRWKGYFKNENNQVPYEVLILPGSSDIDGYAMTAIMIDGSENIGLKEITARVRKGQLEIEDAELVFSNFSKPGKRVVLAARLKPNATNNPTILTGRFKTRSLDFRDNSYYEGEIYLKKEADPMAGNLMTKLSEMKLYPVPEQSAIVAATDQQVKKKTEWPKPIVKENAKEVAVVRADEKITNSALPPAAYLSSRKIEVINAYYFKGDSIDINFYDNGTIDGDTITVLLDSRVLLAKRKLDIKPIHEIIRIPKNADSLLLIMYAENLGSLPPNTGLLVMTDGYSRNEIRFAGDLTKSSSIQLIRKK